MKYKVTLNNRTYEVEVEAGKAMLVDEYEAYAPAPAAPAPAAAAPAPAAPEALAAGEAVNAPMPGNILKIEVKQGDTVKAGNILKIEVKQGDTVKAGQLLVILEAMKMENEIVAPKAGTVAQVVAKVGDKVDTGAALIVIA